MENEIRYKFINYINENTQLKKLFDDLSEEDGIMLQYFFEGFAKSISNNGKEPVSTKRIVMPDEAPTNSLPTYEECALRVGNAKYLKDNNLENDASHHGTPLPTPLHEFIYEYDCADAYKSAWWMHRLEKLIEFVKSEA